MLRSQWFDAMMTSGVSR